MSYQAIEYEIRDDVAYLVKCNSGTGYAMDKDATVELRRALLDVRERDDVRAVVIDSKAGIHQGAYLVCQLMDETSPLQTRELIQLGHEIGELIWNMDKPIIGVIRTEGCGGGIEHLHACDFVIAAEDAVISAPEVETGTMCAWGGSQRIPRIVGWRKAQRILMLGEKMSGREAAAAGLITEAVDSSQVDAAINRILTRIKALPAQSIAISKHAMHKAWEMDVNAGLKYEVEVSSLLLAEGLFKDIIKSLMAGEEPDFKPFRHLVSGEAWH